MKEQKQIAHLTAPSAPLRGTNFEVGNLEFVDVTQIKKMPKMTWNMIWFSTKGMRLKSKWIQLCSLHDKDIYKICNAQQKMWQAYFVNWSKIK